MRKLNKNDSQKLLKWYNNKLFQLPKHIQDDIIKKESEGMCSKDIAKWLKECGFCYRAETVARYLEIRKFLKKIAKLQTRRTIKSPVVRDSHSVLMRMCRNPEYQEALNSCQLIYEAHILRYRMSIYSAINICEKFLDKIEAITLVTPPDVLRKAGESLYRKKMSYMSTFLYENHKKRLQAVKKFCAAGNLFSRSDMTYIIKNIHFAKRSKTFIHT